jgi:hypothetical protein
MLENQVSLETAKVLSIQSKKNQSITVKTLCADEDIATVFRLVCQHDLRKKAIEAIEKRLLNIKSN